MVDRGGHETQGHTVKTSIYIYILFILCYISHMYMCIHIHILSSLSFFLTKSSAHQMMRKALTLHRTP